METKIYNQAGEETGKIALSDSVFGLTWNADLVHQVVVAAQANKRISVADTKDRREVSGTGKKPWRQKGTGRARQGQRQSPLWKGGGVTHGPLSEKDYSQKINKKMKRKAFFTALSQKLKDNEILFLDQIIFEEPKTKDANLILKSLSKINGFEKMGSKGKNRAIIALPGKNSDIIRAFGNIPGMEVYETRNLNTLDVLTRKYVVFVNPKETLEILSK